MQNIITKIKSIAIEVWNWIKTTGGRLYAPSTPVSKNAEIITRLQSHKTKIKLRKPKAKKTKKTSKK